MDFDLLAKDFSYFKKNGSLLLSPLPWTSPLETAKSCYEQRSKKELTVPNIGRDLWRDEPRLKKLLTETVAPLVKELSHFEMLRLGLDQWISPEFLPSPLIDAFSIQGILLGVLFFEDSILVVSPEIPIDWIEHLKAHPHIYLAVYTAVNAVYRYQPSDPAQNGLKKFGYNFGDRLQHTFHPVL